MQTKSLGLVKTTLVDYPGLVAATVFTHGCNLRCPYCHNPELVSGPAPDTLLPVEEVIGFLRKRSKVLGGVCITGGEPLLQRWLPEFAQEVRALGLRVKLDTNGLLPDRIEAVEADFVAMDLKVAPERYHLVRRASAIDADSETGSAGDFELLSRSMAVIRRTVPEYEFRTTVVPGVVTESDIRAIVGLLEPGERYALAAFRPGRTLDPGFEDAPAPSSETMAGLAAIARDRGLLVTVREHRR